MQSDEKPSMRKHFSAVWELLFTSPIHLDTALSKLPKEVKNKVAYKVSRILLRPASEARATGIELVSEPWGLEPEPLAHWRTAKEIFVAWSDLEKEGLPLPRSPRPIRADFPSWMRDAWEKDWGPVVCEELISILGQDPPLSLRVGSQFKPQEVLAELQSEKPLPTSAEISTLVPFGIRIKSYAPVLNTQAFLSGKFEIQDEGSQLMALYALWPHLFKGVLSDVPARVRSVPMPIQGELKAVASDFVAVDACAGAGGKTLAMADALGGRGRVFAYDTSGRKLEALKKRASRAGLRNIKTTALPEGEEQSVLDQFKTRADVVLVDAPCSGWGVLRRNPDIKWKPDTEALARMPQIQKRLLDIYCRMVKDGGRLVFGVCTFRKEETQLVVKQFLVDHPEFKDLGGGYLGPSPTDGFFMWSFERVLANR